MSSFAEQLNGWRPTANNMKLEDQCVSLELAKKLKELEVKQESLFAYWPKPKVVEHGAVQMDGYEILPSNYGRTYGREVTISAFTVAELGEMLPRTLSRNGTFNWFCGPTSENSWEIGYRYHGNTQQADTEADARAKMLIYLIENGRYALTTPLEGTNR